MNISASTAVRRPAPRPTTNRRLRPFKSRNEEEKRVFLSSRMDRTFGRDPLTAYMPKKATGQSALLDHPFQGNAFFDEHDRNVIADRIQHLSVVSD